MNEQNKDVVGWITVNGRHIPIRIGETKDQAIKSFTDDYNKAYDKFGKAKSKTAEKDLIDKRISEVKSFVKKAYKDYDESKWVKNTDRGGYDNGDLYAMRMRSKWSIISKKHNMRIAEADTFDKVKDKLKGYFND